MFLAFVGPLLNHSGDIVKAVSELVASSRAGSRWAFGSSKIMHFHRLFVLSGKKSNGTAKH